MKSWTPANDAVHRAFRSAKPLHLLALVFHALEHEASLDAPGCSNGELALALDVDHKTMLRCLKVLSKLGLVRTVQGTRNQGFDVIIVQGQLSDRQLTVLRQIENGQAGIDVKAGTVRCGTEELDLREDLQAPAGEDLQVLTRGVYWLADAHAYIARAKVVTKETLVTNTKNTNSSNRKTDSVGSADAAGPSAQLLLLREEENQASPPTKTARDKKAERDAFVERVFRRWQDTLGYHDEKLTPTRAKHIRARHAEGYTEEQFQTVLTWVRDKPFYRGQNDSGMCYDDFRTLFRSAENFEKYLSHARRDAKRGGTNTASLAAGAPKREARLL